MSEDLEYVGASFVVSVLRHAPMERGSVVDDMITGRRWRLDEERYGAEVKQGWVCG
jgi:hypothetical protein